MIKQNDKTRDIGFGDYYRFVRDGIDQGDLKWGRDNLVLALLFPLVPIALSAIFYGIYPELRTLVLALWAYAVALSLFVLFLLARAPWKHHRQVVAGYHEQLATKEAEIVSLAGQAEQIKAELEAVLKGSVSEKDPRIVPKYVKGYVPISFGPPSAESIGDDHLVLTNLGGSDALDVQVGDIKTGDTRATFSEIPFISSQKSEGIVANIYGFADGKKINTHFHTLDAYCKAAAEKGETSWFGRITYRGCSDDSFETVFTINYLPTKSAIELNGFRFARIPRVLPASKDSP